MEKQTRRGFITTNGRFTLVKFSGPMQFDTHFPTAQRPQGRRDKKQHEPSTFLFPTGSCFLLTYSAQRRLNTHELKSNCQDNMTRLHQRNDNPDASLTQGDLFNRKNGEMPFQSQDGRVKTSNDKETFVKESVAMQQG